MLLKPQVALITVLADDAPALARFYREVLGFASKTELGDYIELDSPGVRLAICGRGTMLEATDHVSYREPRSGQAFELAFPVESPEAVDRVYSQIVAQGAAPVKPPADMPWGQRAAFFADPEGNIHELFADLPPATGA